MAYRIPVRLIFYLIIFFLLLTIIFLWKKIQFNSLSNAVSNVQKKTTGSVSGANGLKYLFAGKEELEKAMQTAEAAQAENLALVNENKRLSGLLELKNYKPHPYTVRCFANIIGANTDGMIYFIVIDRGKQDGVEEGDGIITGSCVIGRVIKAMDGTSQVQLLTDAKSSISVKTERANVKGILTGKGQNLCEMTYVPKEEDVKVGDNVITSPLGTSFPEGIPVGKVTKVNKDSQGLSMSIDVRPYSDVFNTDNVIVVKKR